MTERQLPGFVTDEEILKAWWLGFNDEEQGKKFNNPFPRGSKCWKAYIKGWNADQ
jgi:hypothetical protein